MTTCRHHLELLLKACLLWILFTANGVRSFSPAVNDIVAGAIAGSAGAIVVYPIDYVKSQLQTAEGRAKYSNGLEAALDIIQTSPYGPLALYRGVLVNIIGIAPEKTIKLSVNDLVRTTIQAQLGYLPLVGEVIAGGIAGMTQVIVTNPLEVVKIRLQTSEMRIEDVLYQIKGFRDLYQGVTACMVRDSLFSAILFPIYAHAKVAFAAILLSVFGPDAPSFVADLIAGCVAAFPAAFFATPADVVKTRMQQARSEVPLYQLAPQPQVSLITTNQTTLEVIQAAFVVPPEPQGFIEVTRSIVQKEGPMVLFSGSFERIVRSAPQFGVTLAMFDVVSDFLVATYE